jgi:hypothetical protein
MVTLLGSDPLIPLWSPRTEGSMYRSAAIGKALRSILYQYSWQVKSLSILSSLFLYHISSIKSILYFTLLNSLAYLL